LLQLSAVCAPVTCVLACYDWRPRQRPKHSKHGQWSIIILSI